MTDTVQYPCITNEDTWQNDRLEVGPAPYWPALKVGARTEKGFSCVYLARAEVAALRDHFDAWLAATADGHPGATPSTNDQENR
ncbi:hypothetical protein ABIC28_005154 [Rhodococcus sp. PvR044]|uniref:hypothetical protein n=1 Tax=Rhodococcus sp. PvR044 TaxID=3156402 RepID=UPI003397C498